jgi:hypothetical protein
LTHFFVALDQPSYDALRKSPEIAALGSIEERHTVAGDRSYELAKPEPGYAGLEMHVTDRCNRPSTYTIEFALEDGAWRVARTNHDSSKGGRGWFKDDLKPIKEFPTIALENALDSSTKALSERA